MYITYVLKSLLVVFLPQAQQARPQIHLLLHLLAPVHSNPPAAAPVGPVQLNQSSVYTTAQREPPPAPSNWTSLMNGESVITVIVAAVRFAN